MTSTGMTRAAFVITLLAALLAAVLPLMGPAFLAQEAHTNWVALVVLALCQLLWYWHGHCLTRVSTLPLLLALGAMLASYLIPEHWISVDTFNRWADQLAPGTNIDNWRPPLLELAALITLTLGLLARTRANLGVPLLQVLTALLLLMDATLQVMGNDFAPLVRRGNLYTDSLLTLLLLAQFIGVVHGWQHARNSLIRALWPSTILAMASIAFWYQQSHLADSELQQSVNARYQRMAEQMTAEINTHVTTMRRFSNIWSILDRPPQSEEWRTLAGHYYRDFRYFLNITYINEDREVVHVYPKTPANTHLNILQTQHPGSERLTRALKRRNEEQTDVLPLWLGQSGLIYYLPIDSHQDGRAMGVAAMVVGLPLVAETLYLEGHFDRMNLYLGLLNGDTPIREWHSTGPPGPWRVESDVVFGHAVLTLVAQPNRELLLSERSHQPSLSLSVGLILAYLLYMVLFGRQQMALQHLAVRSSNKELRREVRKRSQLQSEVEWLAGHDELTGVPNRRHFLYMAQQQVLAPLTVLLCDLDHFKSINDRLGHQAGDQALVRVAEIGRQLTPGEGLFARYGGEEFVVLLPHTAEQRGLAVAEQLREGVLNSGLKHADDRPITISIGVAVHREGPLKIEELLHQADLALYEAKHAGRNRSRLWSTAATPSA